MTSQNPSTPSHGAIRQRMALLRVRVALLFLLSMLPLMYAVWHISGDLRETTVERERERLTLVMETVVTQQKGALDDARHFLTMMRLMPEALRPTEANCSARLAALLGAEQRIANLGFTLPDGRVVCSARGSTGANIGDRSGFAEALARDDFVIGNTLTSPITGKHIIPLYRAIRVSGTVVAMAFGSVDIDWINQLLQKANPSTNARSGLIDSKGVLISRVPDPEGLVGRNFVQEQLVKTMAAMGEHGSLVIPGLDRVPRIIAFSHLTNLLDKRLYVWTSIPLADVTAESIEQMWQVLALAAFALVATFTLLWFGSRQLLIRPVSMLETTAARLAAGDLTARSGIPHDGTEMGQVAKSIDDMADALTSMQDTVRANLALKALVAEKRLRGNARDEAQMLASLCQTVVEAGGYHAACVGYAQHDESKSVSIVASWGLDEDFLKNAVMSWGDENETTGKGPMARAIRSGQSVVVNDLQATGGAEIWKVFASARETRSVLGMPLRIDDRIVGGLLIYSKLPDAFGRAELDILEELAFDVGASISALREREARREAEMRAKVGSAQLAEAQHIARLGSWELDFVNDRFTASDEMFHIAGVERGRIGSGTAAMMEMIHPDDRDMATGVFREAVSGGREFRTTHRVLRGDGGVRVLEVVGRTTYGRDGKAVRILGTSRDITEEHALRIAVRERMKELRCLYEVFRVTDRAELSLQGMLEAAAAALPAAWQHDADCAARIRFRDLSATTPGFAETAWTQTATFEADGTRGDICVAYMQPHDKADEGPFLNEERTLIETLAGRIGESIERRTARARLKDREEIFSTIVNQAQDSIGLFDVESGRFVEFNEAAHARLGYTREEFARLRVSDFSTDPEELIRANIEHMLQPGGAAIETRNRHRDGSLQTVAVRGRSVNIRGRSMLSVIWSDITERKRVEEALYRSNREVRAISEALRHVVFAETEAELLENICAEMVKAGGYVTAWVGHAETDEQRSIRPLARAGTDRGYIDEIRLSWADNELGRGPAGTAIRHGRPAIVRDMVNDPAFAPWADIARRHGLASSLGIPLLIGEDHAEAVLLVYSDRADAFDDAEVELLIGLGQAISFGIKAMRDRMAREAAQRAAAETGERLGHLLDVSPVVVYTLRYEDGRFLPGDVSANLERLLGYSPKEVQDPDWWYANAHPDDRDRALTEAASVRGAQPVTREYRFRHKDGRYMWMHDNLRALREEDGKVVELVGAWSDVTERRKSEDELRKLSMAVEQSVEIIMITDLDAKIEYVNEAFVHHTGYVREEVMGRNPRFLQSGKTSAAEYAAMWRSLSRGMPWSGEFTNRRKDGTEIIESAFISPLRQSDGRITHFVAVKQNVTEQRAIDAQLNKLSMAVNQSPESIAITDIEARLEYVNDAFLHNTGYSREEVIGQNSRILHSGKTPRASYDEMWAALTAGKPWKGEFVNKRKDGSEYTELAIIAPIRDAAGNTTHYLAIKDDISDRKRMGAELDNYRRHLEDLVKSRTAELIEARERADAANVAKSTFLANMSHEIRTPMNAIIGLTHLMRRGSPTPDQDERLNKIDASARHLLVLINDILDLSKIEAGKMDVERLDFDPARVMNESFAIMRSRAEEKRVAMVMEIDPTLPASVNGDPLRLRQILLNLGSNAVKFTEHGSVTLRVRVIGADAERVTLRFEMQDTGIGMTEEQRSRLFRAFEQADVSTTRKYGGSGLGLVISQRLAGLMGGVIDVESTPGRGSLFTLTVPFDRSVGRETLPVAGAVQGALAGHRALIALRDTALRHALRLELEEAGMRVEEMDDLAQARRAAQDAANAGDPAAFVLAQWQAGQPWTHDEAHVAAPRAVALIAGHANPTTAELQQDGYAAGIGLPLQKNTLRALLAELLAGGTAASALRWHGSAEQQAVRRDAVHVLLVDDDDINQEVGRELLIERGFRVDVAANGAAALAAAERHAYDLVLMDLQMPVMDGLTAAREMRGMAGYAATPILAMTANAYEEDRRRAMAAGMNDFITKPVEPQLLFDTLARWLPAMPEQQTHGGGMNAGGPRNLAEQLAGIDGLDVAAGLAVFQGHEAAYEHVLGLFMQRHAGDAAAIRAQLADGQTEAARRSAHTLKGTAASLGAHALRDLATQIEKAIADGAPPRDLETLITTLDAASGALIARLEACLPAATRGEAVDAPTDIDWGQTGALLERIAALLAEDDVRATRAWQTDAALLGSVLGEAAARIEKHIAAFAYDRALVELRQVMSTIPQLAP